MNDKKAEAFLMSAWNFKGENEAKIKEVKKIVQYFISKGFLRELAKADIGRFSKYNNILDLYLSEMGVLTNGVKSVEVEELDSNYPSVFKNLYSLDKKVIIRSQNNLNLFRDEMNK